MGFKSHDVVRGSSGANLPEGTCLELSVVPCPNCSLLVSVCTPHSIVTRHFDSIVKHMKSEELKSLRMELDHLRSTIEEQLALPTRPPPQVTKTDVDEFVSVLEREIRVLTEKVELFRKPRRDAAKAANP